MGPGNVATKSVGSDEYGNQYYEDFDTYCIEKA
jgi:NADH:ubiquinone oxidoreductase subunit